MNTYKVILKPITGTTEPQVLSIKATGFSQVASVFIFYKDANMKVATATYQMNAVESIEEQTA